MTPEPESAAEVRDALRRQHEAFQQGLVELFTLTGLLIESVRPIIGPPSGLAFDPATVEYTVAAIERLFAKWSGDPAMTRTIRGLQCRGSA